MATREKLTIGPHPFLIHQLTAKKNDTVSFMEVLRCPRQSEHNVIIYS